MSKPTSVALSLTELATFNQELAALVQARVPLESHLRRVGRERSWKQAALFERLSQRLEAGDDLATALEAEGDFFPAIYPAVVRAGQRSGRLSSALESLVETCSRLSELRAATGLAIIYPLQVIFVACLVFSLLAAKILPSFDWIHRKQFSGWQQMFDTPRAEWVLNVGIPVALALAALLWWTRSAKASRQLAGRDRWWAWLPFGKHIRFHGTAATLAELLHLLIANRVPLPEALRLAGNAVGDPAMKRATIEMSERVAEGQSPPSILQSQVTQGAKLPPLVQLALAHADQRAMLERGLQQAATIYRERALRTADWVSEYLPIVLTAAVGGTVVLGLALALFWPYTTALYEMAQPNWD